MTPIFIHEPMPLWSAPIWAGIAIGILWFIHGAIKGELAYQRWKREEEDRARKDAKVEDPE